MSEPIPQHIVNALIARLVKQSTPDTNDERHELYVKNVNVFLKYFGREQVHLLGSTGEQLKLRSEKDGGDADFLLCTGKLEISVKDIEQRSDVPCFVWIKKGMNVDDTLKLDLVDGIYLPSSVLRSVGPEMFNIVRGIFKIFTRTSDSKPGSETRVTTTGLGSKVGLARNQYRNLVIDENILPVLKTANNNFKIEKTSETKLSLQNRKKDVAFNSRDVECLNNILDVIALFKKPDEDLNRSQFNHFAELLHIVLERIKEEKKHGITFVPGVSDNDDTTHYYQNDLNIQSAVENGHIQEKRQKLEDELKTIPDTVKGSYLEKTSKDFVPAIRLAGKLPFMEQWKASKKQLGGWPGPAVVDAIYDLDVFVVSKYAPVNPDIEKDFCLSFNLAEIKLSKCLTPVQRKVLLILKCYLKGVIANECIKRNCTLKLTTYHLKTALYRVLETADLGLWNENNIIKVVVEVLEFLTNALCEGELLHFFVPMSNLFHGFNDDDYDVLLECVIAIQADPVGSIETFFSLDDGQPVVVEFNKDEIIEFMDLKDDGGKSHEADVIEDALIDFQRGFNDGPRDEHGNSPINEAILDVVKIFLKDEGNKWVTKNIPKEFGGLLSALVPGLVESVASSNEGEEVFATLKQFLDCPCSEKDRKDLYKSELERKAKNLFHF